MGKYTVAYVVADIPKIDRVVAANDVVTYYCGQAIVLQLPAGHTFVPDTHLAIDIVEAENESDAMTTVIKQCPNWILQLTAKKVA